MSYVTSGRPSIRPPSNPVRVAGGRGGADVNVGAGRDCEDIICGVVDEGDEEIEAAPEEEPAARARPLPTPFQPSLSQYLDHCLTHYPYQSWCPHCVEGRGREFGHHTVAKESSAAPTISFDYAFVGDNAEIKTQEEFESAGEAAVKLLVVRDDKSKAVFGHVVPQKGVDEKGFSVSALVEDVRWLGYTKLILKSDNEPSIVKLLSEALRELRIDGQSVIMEEHPPEYDPQANGSAEVGVKLVKGQFRTMRSCLESDLGFRIPVQHPLIAWLVRHAAATVTWSAKGHDGMTAYQRVRSKPFSTRLLGFGELCRFKNRSQEPMANIADGRRVHSGVFLGVDRRTGQYMLWDGEALKLARSVFRVPTADKWDKDALAKVSATPYSLHAPKEVEVTFREPVDPAGENFKPKVVLARAVWIKKSDIDKYGLTRGCAKCDHERDYGPNRTSKGHSKVCRDRIMVELAKTPEGQARIAAAVSRLDKTVADLGQPHRTDLPQGEIASGTPVEQNQSDDVVVPPQFLPLRKEQIAEPPTFENSESREVPPPAEEAGGAETHRASPWSFEPRLGPPGGFNYENSDDGRTDNVQAAPGMEVDVIDHPEDDLRELMKVLGRADREEVLEANSEIMSVVRSLGGNDRKFRRERSRAIKAVVSEVYSPPRVTASVKLLPELRLIPGFALDLTTADVDGRLWDFDEKEMRDRAMAKVKQDRPQLLIGSPMCTAFSTWQRINNLIRDPVTVAGEKRRAVQHLTFCVELYREQLKHGRYFLHEHPAHASSWQEDIIKGLLKEKGVVTATCDQCLYGSEAPDGSPIKKPTTFMTNAPELAGELEQRCQGRGGDCSRKKGGSHAQCRGKVARMAAVYDFKLCRAILVGFRKQLQKDGMCKDGFVGMLEATMEREDVPATLPCLMFSAKNGQVLKVQVSNGETFRDDLIGQELDPELVRAARAKELEYFDGKNVWELRSADEC